MLYAVLIESALLALLALLALPFFGFFRALCVV
jgi:hypothetical protein